MKSINKLAFAIIACCGLVVVCVLWQQSDRGQLKQMRNVISGQGADPIASAASREVATSIAALEDEARERMRKGNLNEAQVLCLQALTAQDKAGDTTKVFTRNLLAEIYVRSGQYQKGLDTYLPNYKYTGSKEMNLNVALAYVRLGKYNEAKRFYSDQSILRYNYVKTEKLPGTSNARLLEASILLSRGLDSYLGSETEMAFDDFKAASELAPNNAVAPYYAGRSLMELKRYKEAEPFYQQAARYGRGKIGEDAKRRADAFKAEVRPGPPPKIIFPPQAPPRPMGPIEKRLRESGQIR